jgi:hypothetical protein
MPKTIQIWTQMTLLLFEHGVWPIIRKFIKFKLIECGFDHGINLGVGSPKA